MTMGDTFGPAERRPQLRGVSGWLLFLCITLIVFLPIRLTLTLWAIVSTPKFLSSFADSALEPAAITLLPAVAFALLLVLALPVLGIVGGALLYWERLLGVRLVQVFFGLQIFFGGAASLGGSGSGVIMLFWSCAWLVYLFRSERVQNTYFKGATSDAAEVFR